MEARVRRFWKRFNKTINKPEMSILPGQLAFFFVLSVIPLIALLGSLAILFGIDTQSIVDLLDSTVPKAVSELLLPIVLGESLNFNMIVFYVSAFILASNGTHSMIIASNTLYKFENKNYLSRRIKALIMAIILVMLLLFTLVVPAFGDKIVSGILTLVQNNIISYNIELLYNLFKYPLSFVLIYFCIKLLYVLAPDAKIKSKDTTYGSVFTTLGWIVASDVYSIYVDVFAKYNIFYGSLSNIIILLFWVYILAYIFVFGMALNAGVSKVDKQEINN